MLRDERSHRQGTGHDHAHEGLGRLGHERRQRLIAAACIGLDPGREPRGRVAEERGQEQPVLAEVARADALGEVAGLRLGVVVSGRAPRAP